MGSSPCMLQHLDVPTQQQCWPQPRTSGGELPNSGACVLEEWYSSTSTCSDLSSALPSRCSLQTDYSPSSDGTSLLSGIAALETFCSNMTDDQSLSPAGAPNRPSAEPGSVGASRLKAAPCQTWACR